MKNLFRNALRTLALVAAVVISATVAMADDAPLTEEFCEEGIAKCETALDNIVKNINEITTPEQLQGLQRAVNTIEFRNVRKKYGKIQLTDAQRERLIEANKKVAQAMKDMLDRLGAPFDVREALSAEISDKKIEEEITKCKTLREAMQ